MGLLVDRCEEAFASVLSAPIAALGAVFDGATASVVTGKHFEEKPLPVVICSADGNNSDEETQGTGNFFLDVEITVKHRAVENPEGDDETDAPKDSSQDLLAAVETTLEDTNLATALSAAASGFFVFPAGVFRKSPTSGRDEAGVWVNQYNYRILCCASDISA